MTRKHEWVLIGLCAFLTAAPAAAQVPTTLQQALATAEAASPLLAVARADSAMAEARLLTALARPNPDLALDYSKSPPQYHLEIEQAIELPGLRSARSQAASAGRAVALMALSAERAALRHDVVLAYVRAAGALEISRLTVRNAADAAELLRIAQVRRDAGDASELDVRLASIFAGQAINEAFADSLTLVTTTLELQALLGLRADALEITPRDSLQALGPAELTRLIAATPGASGTGAVNALPAAAQLGPDEPLRVEVARSQLAAEEAALSLALRSRTPAPTLRGGFETHDPSGDETGFLPTLGVSIPLPLWNRNRGEIAEAQAAVARATAELEQVRRESRAALGTAARSVDVLRLKVERGRAIVTEAEQVAALARTAYAEGEYPLASVLEAQRSARDAVRSYLEDLLELRLAEAALLRGQIVGGVAP